MEAEVLGLEVLTSLRNAGSLEPSKQAWIAAFEGAIAEIEAVAGR